MSCKSYLSQKGQALLVVVLVMVIALTVGLSVATKSITNIRTSTEEASSQKALSAAEAGIQQVIKTKTPIAAGTFTDSTYKTDITTVSGATFLLNAGNPIAKDDGIDLWLSTYSTDSSIIYTNPWSGNLTVYWGSPTGECNNAALEIAVISGSKSAPVLRRYNFDPCTLRRSTNHFDTVSAGGSVAGKTFSYSKTIAITNGLIAKIVPLYANTSIGINGNGIALPSQGSVIISTGTSGGTKRKVTVFQGFPELPAEYFPFSLFTP